MNFKTYTHLPPKARALREEVFCKEQGFQEEFDAQDLHCRHGLLWNDQGDAVGVCRFFPGSEPGVWILGRIAVSRSVRGRGAGSLLVKGTEAAVKELGGTEIRLHAQVRAQHFYKALGYEAYGPVEPEEGVPHQWMKKQVG